MKNSFPRFVYIVLSTALITGFGTNVQAGKPDTVDCVRHVIHGHECWDTCSLKSSGSAVTGSYHDDGLWHDGLCGIITIKPNNNTHKDVEVPIPAPVNDKGAPKQQ